MSETPLYRLFHYWRSSSSWRVRFALNWKSIPFEPVPVNLLNGESESPQHLNRNPAGLVPVLEIIGASDPFLCESLAIIQYLEATHPSTPTLLPGSPIERARIWALAEVINSGTQPIQNIPVMERHSSDPAEQKKWSQHFIAEGLRVYETLCSKTAGRYSVGNHLSIADVCLVPQIYNAERYHVDLSPFPALIRISEEVKSLPAYQSSHPDQFKPIDFKG